MEQRTLTLDPRFNGPPRSANGGYAAGILAQYVDGPAVVRLMAPPPLGKALTLELHDQGCLLRDGETGIARASPGESAIEPPPAPAWEAVDAARERFPETANQLYQQCFVCGAAREPGDGLRVFPGPLPGGEAVAAVWSPAAELANTSGAVRPEYVWAALDCPGAFAIGSQPGEALLLGEMTARLDTTVAAGASYRILGWRLGAEGRKQYSGTAIYDADDRCLAYARGTWFAVPVERVA